MNGQAALSADQIRLLRGKCKDLRSGGGGGGDVGGIGGVGGGVVWISVPVWIETADQPILSWETFGVFVGIPVQRK